MQHNKYFEHQGVKIHCSTNQFPKLKFLGTHKKPHSVRGLGNNDQICFDTKTGHGPHAIRHIPYNCTYCTYSIEQPWIPVLTAQQQPSYQPIKDCTYWPVFGSFNNWNIIKLSHKATYSEELEKLIKLY